MVLCVFTKSGPDHIYSPVLLFVRVQLNLFYNVFAIKRQSCKFVLEYPTVLQSINLKMVYPRPQQVYILTSFCDPQSLLHRLI